MGIIDIELVVQNRPWGLFTEEKQPRIILPMWLTKKGQKFSCCEEDLTPNQVQVIENSYRQGIINVIGASFLNTVSTEEETQIFEEPIVEETPFQKLMREKTERLNCSKEKTEKEDSSLNEEEVKSFLKRRQDKVLVDIKKAQKSLSFFKDCRAKELKANKTRKKVIAALEEVIELKIASIKNDVGGMVNPDKSNPESLLGGQSLLEQQYGDMITEVELNGPEKQKELSPKDIEKLLKRLEEE